MRHPGKLLSQRKLLTEVWGPGYETAQGNLRVYMAQLRRKLEPDPAISSTSGMGNASSLNPDLVRHAAPKGHPHDDR